MYTRTRTQGGLSDLSSLNPVRKLTNFAGGVTTVPTAGRTYVSGGPHKVMMDAEVPRFESRRAKGEVFMNPMESFEVTSVVVQNTTSMSIRSTPLYSGEATSSWKSDQYIDQLDGELGTSTNPMIDRFSVDMGTLNTLLLDNAQHQDIAWNMALSDMAATDALLVVTAVEFKKTVSMLGEYLFHLTTKLGPLRTLIYQAKNKQISPRKAAEAIAGEWLKIRYGVMPTVYEIQGVVNALLEPSKPERLTARGRSTFTDYKTEITNFPSISFRPGRNLSVTTEVSSKVRAGVLYKPVLDSLSSRLGLHPSVLPEVAFELTYLSFVGNWFFDLSNTVRALRAFVHGESLGGWISYVVEGSTTRSIASDGSTASSSVSVGGVGKPTTWVWSAPPSARAEALFIAKRRVPQVGLVPSTPSLRVQMNWMRYADSAALLATIFSETAKQGRAFRSIRI